MTRFALLSDLHQEFMRADPHTAWVQKFRSDGALYDGVDAVVFAGDIDVPAKRSLEWIAERFSGIPAVYVLGNHDYYQFHSESSVLQTYPEVLDQARATAAKLGIHLLENDCIEIAGARFIGCTLWTDFRLQTDIPMFEKMQKARGRFGMNDYRRIKRPSQLKPAQRRRLRPIDTIGMHIDSCNFIRTTLASPFGGPSIVVSHHAPHPLSFGSQKRTDLDHCYASDLSSILEGPHAPDIWVHGHIHEFSDYRIGATRVVANPMGYLFSRDGHSEAFDPCFVVEV